MGGQVYAGEKMKMRFGLLEVGYWMGTGSVESGGLLECCVNGGLYRVDKNKLRTGMAFHECVY